MSRSSTFYSLGLMPALMGLGHLAPAIGAIQTATGSYRFPLALLGLIGTISGLVDSIDTYKDVPVSSRPSKWIWRAWVYGSWSIVLLCTIISGFEAALIIYRVLPLGLLWGAPCIPKFAESRLTLAKPKTLLCEGKSLVVALCMASVSAQASMAYYCMAGIQCSDEALQTRSFYLAVLYHFFRETSCDVRDIDEDTEEGLETLPVKLGKRNTMLLMAIGGLLADSVLTQSIAVTAEGILLSPQFAYSLLRVGATIAGHSLILQYPRDNYLAWGIMSSLGLAPVLFAQAALR